VIKKDESYTFNNVSVKFINKSSKGADLYAFKLDDNDIVKDTKFLELFDSKNYRLTEHFATLAEEEVVLNNDVNNYLYKKYLARDKAYMIRAKYHGDDFKQM
jgi:hypothetical protein